MNTNPKAFQLLLTDIENNKDFEKTFVSIYQNSIQTKMEEFKESLKNKGTAKKSS